MLNPRAVLDSGDPYAAKLLEESRNVPMPTPPGITRERAEKLLDLIQAESKLEESQFKGLQISNKPFTDADRQAGRALFQGVQRLQAGGTACIACHSVHGQTALGGGRLGPDLTRVYERLKGRQSLSAWLMAPATETMQPAFKNHPLNADEIHALVAYFEELAPHSEADGSAGRAAFLLLGLGAACGCVFVLDAAWKRRFRDVRRSLVRGQSK
jgi:mono/diheme cytochrome c family protein